MTANDQKALRFPCECVSNLAAGYTDPWAEVSRRRLLPNGTKEQIVNLVADEPKTVSQLAHALNLSAPSVHTHINELVASELLRESEEFEKRHPSERYYEPNFPVFKAEECAEFKALCEQMAEQLATLFERRSNDIKRAFRKTDLPSHGWEVSDITQCLFTNMYRSARTLLEERGLLASAKKHRNGAQWIFWAQEAEPTGETKKGKK